MKFLEFHEKMKSEIYRTKMKFVEFQEKNEISNKTNEISNKSN